MDNDFVRLYVVKQEFKFKGNNYRAVVEVTLKTAGGNIKCSECGKPTVEPADNNKDDHGYIIVKAGVKGIENTDGMFFVDLDSDEGKQIEKHIVLALSDIIPRICICGDCFPSMDNIFRKNET